MAAQARSARKRPLGAADESDSSEGNESSGSLSEWQPSPSPSRTEMPGTSSSASDGAGQQLVIAPPPEQTQFESWEAFEDYLSVYQAQSFQVFRVRANTTAADRNAKMDTQGSKAPRIPVEWVQYARTFVCTHHGKYLSTATSKRPRQETRAQGCNAQINTCVQVVDKVSKKFAVKITRCRLEHNHSQSEYAFTGHSSNRVSIPDNTLQTVDELRKAGAKKTNILKFIKENSDSNPTAQDVQNLVRKLKARENGKGPSSRAKRLKTWMSEFGDRPGNVGRIFVDEVDGKKIATCITLQTKHMWSLFKQFPEVLLIDATHGTNRSKYKVFSFMAHDTFGKGQFVQHALLQNERWPTLLTALEEFKANNPAWTKLQCILIDKDFTEMSVLKKAFPNVAILLCQFHVLKYLREEIASSDYGFSSWQKEQLRDVMSLLVYAKTETEYMKHFQYTIHLVEMGSQTSVQAAPNSVGQVGQVGQRSGLDGQLEQGSGLDVEEQDTPSNVDEALPRRDRHPFIAYFVKNWDECRDLWCAHKRQNTVTLGNNTNNRLVASWKQLKEWVN